MSRNFLEMSRNFPEKNLEKSPGDTIDPEKMHFLARNPTFRSKIIQSGVQRAKIPKKNETYVALFSWRGIRIFERISQTFLRICQRFLRIAQKFLRVAQKFLGISWKFLRVAQTFLRFSQKFLRISQRFLDVRRHSQIVLGIA